MIQGPDKIALIWPTQTGKQKRKIRLLCSGRGATGKATKQATDASQRLSGAVFIQPWKCLNVGLDALFYQSVITSSVCCSDYKIALCLFRD